MTKIDDALSLAEETLEQLELGAGPLIPIVLRCLRLARMLDKSDAEGWFRMELRGAGGVGPLSAEEERYAVMSGRVARQALGTNPPTYWTMPIEDVESELEIARKELDALRLPSITVSETGERQFAIYPTASEAILKDVSNRRQAAAGIINRWNHIVACLRGAIDDWLSRTVVELRYGVVVDSVFERARKRFDDLLAERAPDVGRKLSAAYQRAYSDDREEWSQALTSCRRAIKALADAVYPPTDEKVDGHSLTDKEYRNRLVRFVADHLKSSAKKRLLDTEIDLVVKRVEALDEIASKGVHADINEHDVELTIIHTYVLAGELLDLLPQEVTEPEVEPSAEKAGALASAEEAESPPAAEGEAAAAEPEPKPRRRRAKRAG